MLEFSLLLITLAKEYVGFVKICVECFLAFVALKKCLDKTHKKGKSNSTDSRKRTATNSTPSKDS